MRWVRVWIALVALIPIAPRALAQAQSPSEELAISADNASTWQQNDTNIIQATGNVTITTDDATLTADNAVIWLSPLPNGLLGEQYAEFALIGNAKIVHGQATRTNDSLYSTEVIRGRITFYGQRSTKDASDTDLYRQAEALRSGVGSNPSAPPPVAPPPINTWLLQPPSTQPEQPTSRPTTQPSPVYFQANHVTQTIGTDGKVAFVLEGNVLITQRKANKALANMPATNLNQNDISDHVELRSERGVLLTELDSLRQLGQASQFKLPEEMVQGAYLEGDVRIAETPSIDMSQGAGPPKPENRLECQRVYYEFATDRAVLTDAVIHTLEPKANIPIIVRANVVHQLSEGEYRADHAELTTSAFLVPSYSIRTSTAYIRQVPSSNPLIGNETTYVAHNAVFNIFHVPVFYLPVTAGQTTDHGDAVRNLEIGSSKNNGFGVQTQFGLFETFGGVSTPALDMYYTADYFSERGPAFGLNAKYENGYITETTRQPWDFQGDFKSFFLPNDMGVDKLGKDRKNIDPGGPNEDPFRGDLQFEHQHFFPDDWQAQLRLGIVSDPTFLEYWDEGTFDSGLPHDAEAYLKHQKDIEAFTLLVEFQPNDFVTTADQLQNAVATSDTGTSTNAGLHPFEVERTPEVGYYRIGDDLGSDNLTFFSQNTASVLRFNVSGNSLADYGFTDPSVSHNRKLVSPGLPSLGQTGITNNHVYRVDSREELDFPFPVGQFKAVPYVMGRLTSYSDSPDDGELNRMYGGAGLRMTTAFWRVDDTAESDLFDIHRLRHVIEPELNLFTSVENKDRNDVFIYDEAVDDIYDVSAVQLALRQRWETKRGGPGNWRNVDFFSLNVELNLYDNAPDDSELPPGNFRGLFYTSAPEESIPRSNINTDALWRISDTTVVLADLNENIKDDSLATASVGLAVQRDIRTQYFAGLRYIGDINSTIATFLLKYELSAKYSTLLQYSFNFSQNSEEETSFMIIRKFDRFDVTFEYFYDAIENDSGFRIGVLPEGLGASASSTQLQNLFGGSQQ